MACTVAPVLMVMMAIERIGAALTAQTGMIGPMATITLGVLLLDEPTNHLDLESIQALNNGLVDYAGVVLFHSHDQEFINSIANRIIEITPNGIIDKYMSYEEFAEDAQIKERKAELYKL